MNSLWICCHGPPTFPQQSCRFCQKNLQPLNHSNLQLPAGYVLFYLKLATISAKNIDTVHQARGSGFHAECRPCSIFICLDIFLVTGARNGYVVGLGVSTNAGVYFHSVLLQSTLHKQLLNPRSDKKKVEADEKSPLFTVSKDCMQKEQPQTRLRVCIKSGYFMLAFSSKHEVTRHHRFCS